jgi:hypothetical protein
MPDTSTPPTGTTNTQGLAPWAAPYITDYLSRAQTLANEPTQVYQGQLTAGPSQLQNQAFAGIGGLTVPTGIGQGAYDAGQYGRMAANTQYQPQTMNFLGQSFAPQQQQQYTPQPAYPTKQPPIDNISYPTGGVRGPLGGGGGSYDGSGINPGGMYNQPTGGVMGGPMGGNGGVDLNALMQKMQSIPKTNGPQDQGGAMLNSAVQSFGPNGQMTGGMPMGGGMGILPGEGDYMNGPNPMTGGPMEQQPKGIPQIPSQPAQSIAQQYMNPYLQASLDPQLAAAKRAAEVQAQSNNAAMTKAGAFGGGRQAILTSEGQRNLGDTMSNITGQGYNTAYDKAMQQFNADQDRQMKESQFGTTSRLQGLQTGIQGAQTQGQLADTQNKANLSNLNTQMNAGDVQRGITSEGIKADYDEWMRQKDDPYKKAQFQKDMLAGLPVGSMTNSAAGLSGVAGLISAMGGVGAMNTALGDANSPLGKLLASLGLGTGTTGTTP